MGFLCATNALKSGKKEKGIDWFEPVKKSMHLSCFASIGVTMESPHVVVCEH